MGAWILQPTFVPRGSIMCTLNIALHFGKWVRQVIKIPILFKCLILPLSTQEKFTHVLLGMWAGIIKSNNIAIETIPHFPPFHHPRCSATCQSVLTKLLPSPNVIWSIHQHLGHLSHSQTRGVQTSHSFPPLHTHRWRLWFPREISYLNAIRTYWNKNS